MNAEVIKTNKAAFDFGLNGGNVWIKNKKVGERWILESFEYILFNINDMWYVPDDENAEIVKAFLDGKGTIEMFVNEKWQELFITYSEILAVGLPADYIYRIKPQILRATKGQTYYFINDELNIIKDEEGFLPVDDERYKCGNYFRTKNQAKRALVKVKQAIEEVHNGC